MLRAAVALLSTVLLFSSAALAQAEASRERALRSLEALDRELGLEDRAPANGCMPRPVVMADTVLRLHTELMQASLACDGVYGGTPYARYRAFTRRNADLLRQAQAAMIRHLSVRGDGQALFDGYRTALANEESRFLNRFSTSRYCAIRESRFDTLIGAPPDQVATYAQDLAGRRQAGMRCGSRR